MIQSLLMATDAELTKIAHETATKMWEFHQDDMKVMREYMDVRFDAVDRRFESMQTYMDTQFDAIDKRFDRVEERIDTLETETKQVKSALQMLLEEFKQHREEVDTLKREVTDLRARLEVLEAKVLRGAV